MIEFYTQPQDHLLILQAPAGAELQYQDWPVKVATTKGHQQSVAFEETLAGMDAASKAAVLNQLITHLLDTAEVMTEPPPDSLQPDEVAIVDCYNRPLLEATNTWRVANDRMYNKVLVLPALMYRQWPLLAIVHARTERTSTDTEWTVDTPDTMPLEITDLTSFSFEFGAGRPRLYKYPNQP